jgi:hypothetical protein
MTFLISNSWYSGLMGFVQGLRYRPFAPGGTSKTNRNRLKKISKYDEAVMRKGLDLVTCGVDWPPSTDKG